ncbi:MAG: hypothetical protein LBQ30_10050, partial [Treponema sp.]|nr:hypothetical protein [Treponema sp.]
YAYGEVSTAPLVYRKLFCWGTGRGGRRWQDFLSLPGERYLEVQAGLAPTQLHTADMDPGGVTDWVQAFTALRLDPEQAHQEHYRAAAEYTEDRLFRAVSPSALGQILEAARQRANTTAEIRSLGSGWGALERQRNPAALPAGLSFPDDAIGAVERPWAELIRYGQFLPRPVEAGPGSFAVDPYWEALLRRSLAKARRDDWLTPYHLGVIAFEHGETEKAEAYWEASIAAEENAWAYRNLAVAALRQTAAGNGKAEAALAYYKKAFDRPECRQDSSFAEEYLPLLIEQGQEEEAAHQLAAYLSDPVGPCLEEDLAALPGPLLDVAARIAFARGDDALLDRIFSLEPAHIREGNTSLFDLWAAREARRLAAGYEGKPEPPRSIDFRMYIR